LIKKEEFGEDDTTTTLWNSSIPILYIFGLCYMLVRGSRVSAMLHA